MRGLTGLRGPAAALAVAGIVTLAAAGSASAGKPEVKGKERAPGQAKAKAAHEAHAHGGAVHSPSPQGHAYGLERKEPVPAEVSHPTPRRSSVGRQPAQSAPHSKVTLCHATGSATNPYVLITVSVNATTGNGHGRHEDDLIPAPAGGCPAGSEDSGGDDPGPGGEDPGAGGDGVEQPPNPSSHPPRDPSGGPVATGTTVSPASHRSLPFTGLPLAWIVLLGLGCLGGGLALRGRGAGTRPAEARGSARTK